MGLKSSLQRELDELKKKKSVKAKPADYRLTDISGSRKTIAEQFVKQAEGLNNSERKELLKALNEGMVSVEKELPRKNNIAYAMAGLIGLSITIAKGVDMPEKELETLASGCNVALGSNPDWKKTSAKDKQTLYETMLISAVLMIMQTQAEDQETKDAAVATARNILTSFGVEK